MGSLVEQELLQSQLQTLAGDVIHVHLVEQWIILTSNEFDLKIPDLPPFQSLSVLYNFETGGFVCRSLGRSLEQGSFDNVEQLAKFAQETFQHKSACIGSGDFPSSLIYSLGCAKYAPRGSSSTTRTHDFRQNLSDFRCKSCQKDRENDTKSDAFHQGGYIPKVEMDVSHEADHTILVHDANGDDDRCPVPFELDLKTENEIDTELESSAAELNDLVDYIKDDHNQSYSIFDSNSNPSRKSTRIKPSKQKDRPSQSKADLGPSPSLFEKKKVKVIYPKNVNDKPRPDGKYECEHCGHALNSRKGKIEHKTLKHGWGSFRCELCPSLYKEALEYVRHVMKAHVGIRKAMCPRCRISVHFEGDEQVFEGHYLACIRSHRDSKNAILIARRRENKPEPVQSTCDTCGRQFNSLNMLKIHQRLHEGKGFVCKECGFWASHRSVLNFHMKKHEVERGTALKHICPHCAHVCMGDFQFTNHMKRRHRPIQCTQCPKVLLGLLLFNKHNSEVHEANRCDTCGMCFSTSFLLRRHQVIHLEPSFSCQFCPKMFKTERCKNTHERVHTGETPFKCRLCDYKCKSSATLSLHKKYKHNGGRRLRKPLNEEIDE